MPRVTAASISSLGAPKLRYSDVLLDYSAFCAPPYLSVCLFRFNAFRKEVTPWVIPANPAVKTVQSVLPSYRQFCVSWHSAIKLPSAGQTHWHTSSYCHFTQRPLQEPFVDSQSVSMSSSEKRTFVPQSIH